MTHQGERFILELRSRESLMRENTSAGRLRLVLIPRIGHYTGPGPDFGICARIEPTPIALNNLLGPNIYTFSSCLLRYSRKNVFLEQKYGHHPQNGIFAACWLDNTHVNISFRERPVSSTNVYNNLQYLRVRWCPYSYASNGYPG